MSSATTADEPKLCYNRGCGKEFRESENGFDSCRFHPGEPFFHDAYKGWTCCRKCIDFQEFLGMKGCATGYHSNVKPPEPEKKAVEQVTEVVEVRKPKYIQKQRPSADSPLTTIQTTLSESLKKQTYEQNGKQGDGNSTDNGVEIKAGITQCVNKGCKVKYEGPQTDSETCKFHPGVPIFHEGSKYWSCCVKRTTDFDAFMKQEGCQTGSHLWVKPNNEDKADDGGSRMIKCRYDWHQDGSHVHVVVYAGGKKFDPSKSHVKVNGVKLCVDLSFPEENSLFKENWILAGIINPELSSAHMTPMKVEIKLKKAEPVHWANLNIDENIFQRIDKVEQEAEHKCVVVDPVDLSDL